MNTKNKVILAVVMFVIAGGVAAYNLAAGDKTALDADGSQLPDDAKMVDCVCVDDGKHVKLPPDVVTEFTPRRGRKRAGAGSDLQSPIQYDCADCPSGKAVLAAACPECRTFVARKAPDGSAGMCPKCGIKVGN